MNKETKERIKGIAEGVVRIQTIETPVSAVRRYHELPLEGSNLQQISEHIKEVINLKPDLPYFEQAQRHNDARMDDVRASLAEGPGIRREIVLFDTFHLPWPEARAHRRSNNPQPKETV